MLPVAATVSAPAAIAALLGRSTVMYQSSLPKADLRQFASRFTTASGSPHCAVVKRGEQSRVERLRRQMRERTRSLRAELATAKAAVTTARARALRDAAQAVAAVPR
jgi:hypothetical protein